MRYKCSYLKKTAKSMILKPQRFDFLVNYALFETDDIYGLLSTEPLTTKFDLLRALEEVNHHKCPKELHSSSISKYARSKIYFMQWQFKGIIDLDKDDQWILLGLRQTLWSRKELGNLPIKLYPDIFNEFYGHEKENDALIELISSNKMTSHNLANVCKFGQVASCLPLAKSMGAQV